VAGDANLAIAVLYFDFGQLVGAEKLGKLLDQRGVDAHRTVILDARALLRFGHDLP
jgi:hypothetical protein